MSYVCTKSSKILHLHHCRHIRSIPKENKRLFTKEEAAEMTRRDGYGYCKDCSRMGKTIRKERKTIDQYSEMHHIRYHFDRSDDSLVAISRSGTWKVMFFGKHHTSFLYHKNTRFTEGGLVPGYHNQQVHYPTLVQYFEYMVKHDEFRLDNPIGGKKRGKPSKKYKSRRAKRVSSRRNRDRISSEYVLAIISDWEREREELAKVL